MNQHNHAHHLGGNTDRRYVHKASIGMTAAAVAHVLKQLEEVPDAKGLRFGVKTSGCSGWSYHLSPALSVNDDDIEIRVDECLLLFIDNVSLEFVNGTTIDFVQQGLNRQFKFDNPNVDSECGCGESFSVKPRSSE